MNHILKQMSITLVKKPIKVTNSTQKKFGFSQLTIHGMELITDNELFIFRFQCLFNILRCFC